MEFFWLFFVCLVLQRNFLKSTLATSHVKIDGIPICYVILSKLGNTPYFEYLTKFYPLLLSYQFDTIFYEMIEEFAWAFLVVIPATSFCFLIIFCKCMENVSRFFSVILYFCLWLHIFYVIPAEVCDWYYKYPELEELRIAPYISIPIIYFFFLIENVFSKEWQYLENLGDASNSANIIRNLRSTKPIIIFRVQCYHYETRYRTVTDTKTDDQGRTYTETRTESYQERVNTHRANEEYHYDHHEDKSSDNLDGIKCEGVTRIHLTKGSNVFESL